MTSSHPGAMALPKAPSISSYRYGRTQGSIAVARFVGALVLAVSLCVCIFRFGSVSDTQTILIFCFSGAAIIAMTAVPLSVKAVSILVLWGKSLLLASMHDSSMLYIFPDSYLHVEVLRNLADLESFTLSAMSNVAQTLHVGFYYLYLPFYATFGNVLCIVLLNTVLTTLSGLMLYAILHTRFNAIIAFVTFALFSLSANMFLFGSFLLKDPTVIFFVMVSLYLHLVKRRPLLAVVAALFLVTIRAYAGFSVLAAVLVDIALVSALSKTRKIIILLTVALALLIAFRASVLRSYFDLSLQFVTNTSVVGSLALIPVSLAKFFVAPLPWNVYNNDDAYSILAFDSVVLLFLLVGVGLFCIKLFSVPGLRHKYYIFLVPLLVHAYALGVAYGGDSVRQRSGVFAFILLTAVLGLLYKEEGSSDKRRSEWVEGWRPYEEPETRVAKMKKQVD